MSREPSFPGAGQAQYRRIAPLNQQYSKSPKRPRPLFSEKSPLNSAQDAVNPPMGTAIINYKIKALTIAYRFKAGHRIRLMIANADLQQAWPTPYLATSTIYHAPDRPSQMILPIVPAQNPRLPAPNMLVLDGAAPPRESIYTPEYSITRDLVKNTMTCRNNASTGVNQSDFTVSSNTPAQAFIKSSYFFNTTRLGMAINIEAYTVTSSDPLAFHHIVQLQIRINQHPFFDKSWATSAARPLC